MKVLIADDDEITREVLANTLAADDYEVVTAEDGIEAFEILRRGDCRLVICDWQMPNMDGLELCRRLRAENLNGYVYFILLTGRNEREDILAGLTAGADDYVTKPFEPAELRMRVRAGERMLGLETRDVTIFALAKLAESRDPDTGAHLERVRSYSRVLAEHLQRQGGHDEMNGSFVELMYQTSPLHDIGKVAIPDGILLKPDRLDERELAIMQMHAQCGADTLDAALRQYPHAQFLIMARDIALSHHEHWDGGGYPNGLAGTDIPLCGRVVALADVYDALTSKRVYKPPLSHERARSIILENAGTHFDPAIIDAFTANESTFLEIHERLRDEWWDEPERLIPAA